MSKYPNQEVFMSHFSIGDHVTIRYGRQQGQKAAIIDSQPAAVYKVKVEDGAVLFYSATGLEKAEIPPPVSSNR